MSDPIPLTTRYEDTDAGRLQKAQIRDTRRSQFAGMLFQALAAQAGANATDAVLAAMAATAVRGADVLLTALDKERR